MHRTVIDNMHASRFCVRASWARITGTSTFQQPSLQSHQHVYSLHNRGFHSSRCIFARHDPYKALGVTKSASAAEIKAAYYKLAKLHHPDSSSNPNIAEFQKAQDAYETLTDPTKKREFEQQSSSAYDASDFEQAWSYSTNGNSRSTAYGDIDFDEEDFYKMFNARARSKQPRNPLRKGADLFADLRLTFMESIDGCVKPITYHCDEACSNCNNTGRSTVEKKKTCRTCNGRGFRTVLGPFGRPRKHQCETCVGEGRVESLCSNCHGTGVKSTERQVEVRIPAGITEETNLRLAGMGDAGRRGGQAGDLRLNIHIAPDNSDRFTRQGSDIHANLSVDLGTAVMGGKVPVETIRGTEIVRLTGPLTHGQTVRIRGGGVQKSNSSPAKFGDHVITINISLPNKDQLTPQQQQLLQQLSEQHFASQTNRSSSSSSSSSSGESKKSPAQKLNTTRRTASKKKQAAPEDEDEYDIDEEDLFDFDFGDFEPLHKTRKRKSKKRQRSRS